MHNLTFLLLGYLAGWITAALTRRRLTMSVKAKRNRYKLSEAKKQAEEAIGGATVEAELDSGEVFTLPHPLFYDRETKAALKPIDDADTDAIVRVLLGDVQYDKFIKAGGDPDDINFLQIAVSRDMQDSLRGRPTRSSTS